MKQVVAILLLCWCVALEAQQVAINVYEGSLCQSADIVTTHIAAGECVPIVVNGTINTTNFFALGTATCVTNGTVTGASAVHEYTDSSCTSAVVSTLAGIDTCTLFPATIATTNAQTSAYYTSTCTLTVGTTTPTPTPASNTTVTPTPTPTSTPIPVLSAGMKLSHASWAIGVLAMCIFQLMA